MGFSAGVVAAKPREKRRGSEHASLIRSTLCLPLFSQIPELSESSLSPSTTERTFLLRTLTVRAGGSLPISLARLTTSDTAAPSLSFPRTQLEAPKAHLTLTSFSPMQVHFKGEDEPAEQRLTCFSFFLSCRRPSSESPSTRLELSWATSIPSSRKLALFCSPPTRSRLRRR